MPVNATTYEQTEKLKVFIKSYGNVNAVSIPGRVPGYNSGKLMLLPTSHNKLFVHEKYQTACEDASVINLLVYGFFENWRIVFSYTCLSQNPELSYA